MARPLLCALAAGCAMGKHEHDIVRRASEHVFALFRDAARDGALVYHSYDRARELARAAREIAKASDLDDEQTRIALLAAWFHDAGYAAGRHADGAEGVALARKFLTKQGESSAVADAVEACVRGVTNGVPKHGPQEVLHDALLVATAAKGYVRELRLLRLERERRGAAPVSDVEWTESCIRHVEQNPFRTRHAQLQYNRGRAENLVRLHTLLREQQEEAAEQREQHHKAEKGLGKTVEDLYTDITRNQLKLMGLADRRTATMVHVNAIMLSLIAGLLLRHIESHPHLMAPTLLLVSVNLIAVVISILSMRPPRSVRTVLADDEVTAHDTNLLAMANRLPMSRDEYYGRMEDLARDVPAMRKAMIDATYYIRRMLIWRGKMLRLTYNVFIGGLFVAMAVFVVAVLRK